MYDWAHGESDYLEQIFTSALFIRILKITDLFMIGI